MVHDIDVAKDTIPVLVQSWKRAQYYNVLFIVTQLDFT